MATLIYYTLSIASKEGLGNVYETHNFETPAGAQNFLEIGEKNGRWQLDGIRDIIIRRMREKNLNTNRLSKMVSAKVSRTHVYEYLRGESRISDDKLAALLDALGLEIRPTKKRKEN